MKKTIRLSETDLTNIVRKVIMEQQKTQSKFPFAFDNHTTDFEGEITRDGYLTIRTEMGHEYKVGPIDGVPFVGGTFVQVEKKNGVEKIFIFGNSGKKRELKLKPNFVSKKIK